MHNIVEKQYPVGQGGLHLGIIKNTKEYVAYIYDCGSYCSRRKINCYDEYFANIYALLKAHKVSMLYLYLSHMHNDHYNLLPDFLNGFQKEKLHLQIKINFYIPKIKEPEKIYLLTEYYGNSEKYKDYYNFLKEPEKSLQKYEIGEMPVDELSPKNVENSKKPLHNWILDPFVECASGLQAFKGIKMSEVDTLEKLNSLREEIKSKLDKKTIHSSMICLYSGPIGHNNMKFKCYYENNNKRDWIYRNCHNICGWLHTGDINLKNIINTKFYDYYKSYINNNYVGIMQIPHHCSSHNHDENFCDIFPKDTSGRIFYYTSSRLARGGAKVVPNSSDIKNDNSIFLEIYECPPTFVVSD